jgi:hypothetical protein
MTTRHFAPFAIAALILVGCASDEAPADQTPVESEVDGGFDVGVDDGVDTEVEQSENLGFDEG